MQPNLNIWTSEDQKQHLDEWLHWQEFRSDLNLKNKQTNKQTNKKTQSHRMTETN